MSTDVEDLLTRARPWPKGHVYEDFEPGRRFEHHWGRTLTEGDNGLFNSLTLHYNPLYFNREYARADGHPDTPVNPLLVFLTVFGLSVEDLSEGGGAFLGAEGLEYGKPVYAGDTLTARSEVVDRRESASHPGAGIVTWYTEGFNQRGERVIHFRRSNMIRKGNTGK
ncbi:MAG TPA: MaoC family dehydratase [Gammaproteobacteria bacterium]|nr:MaoC family dehydratase [Gammaproteobacteria bacterium]